MISLLHIKGIMINYINIEFNIATTVKTLPKRKCSVSVDEYVIPHWRKQNAGKCRIQALGRVMLRYFNLPDFNRWVLCREEKGQVFNETKIGSHDTLISEESSGNWKA